MTTDTPIRTTALPSMKHMLLLKQAQLFWTVFSGVTIAVSAAFVAAFSFGISTGFEGQPVFDGSRLSEATGYLFGGAEQFFAFIGVLALIGVALWLANKLSKQGRHTAVLAVIVAAFVVGGLTFRFLAVGENMIPLLVIVAFAAATSGAITMALTFIARRHQRANH